MEAQLDQLILEVNNLAKIVATAGVMLAIVGGMQLGFWCWFIFLQTKDLRSFFTR